MKIKCPDCSTSYDINASMLGTEGRSVKCARCGNRWFVSPQQNDDDDDVKPAQDGDKDVNEWMDDDETGSSEPDSGKKDASQDDWDDGDNTAQPASKTKAAPAKPKKAEPARELAEDIAEDPANQTADIETLANRPKIKINPYKFRRDHIGAVLTWLARRNYRRIGGVALFVGSILICALLVLNRASIVRQAPDLASLYQLAGLEVNLRGLEFRDLRTFSEINEGERVLVVEGTIRNVLEAANRVPAVRLTIRGTDLQDIYAWTVEPRTASLNPLDETRFRTILANPPEGATDIQVRFIDRTARQVVLE